MRTSRQNSYRVWIALLLVLAASACVPATQEQTSVAPIRGEWKTTAVPSTVTAHQWKGITAGKTTRDEVEKRFQPMKQLGELVSLYRIDQIDAAITYGAGNRVVLIRTPMAIELTSGRLVQRFGEPNRKRALRAGGQAFDYDVAGLSIEYADANTAARSLEMRVPSSTADQKADEMFESLVPIRPPVPDIGARIRRVQDALSQSEGGFSWVGREREHDQAVAIYNQMVAKNMLIDAPELQHYASGLMSRLSSVTPELGFEWHLYAMKGELPNAMNTGGGYVYITQALLEQLDSEGQLAYVISHEMAHQLKGHLASTQTKSEIANVLVLAAAIAATAATGSADIGRAAMDVGNAATAVGMAPFSQAQETEADLIALDIMDAAGYDPREARSALDRVRTIADKYGSDLEIVSTHPRFESRQGQLAGWLESHPQDYSKALKTTYEFESIRARYRLNPW